MTILCATDFSPCSQAAVALATAAARRLRQSVMLLHVVQPPSLGAPEIPVDAAWVMALQEAARVALARAALEVRGAGVEVEERIINGDPCRVILETAQSSAVSLVVVGTHGRKGLGHLFVGSVAEALVRMAPCPLLITQAATDISGWTRDTPLRLAAAADGTGTESGLFAWLAGFGKAVPHDLTVVRLYSPQEEAVRYGLADPWSFEDPHPQIEALLERDLRKRLAAVPDGERVRIRHQATNGDAASALSRQLSMLQPDALVLGLALRRSPGAAALSPVNVVRASAVPVLCLPEPQRSAAGTIAPPRSLLLATDLSDLSRAAIPAAYGVLAAGGGLVNLCVVHERGAEAETDTLPLGPPLTEAERTQLEARLRQLIPADSARLGIDTTVLVIEARSVAEALLQAAERLDVDVIALASHGRSGLARAVLGSVADQVVRRASRPVLVVHARTEGND